MPRTLDIFYANVWKDNSIIQQKTFVNDASAFRAKKNELSKAGCHSKSKLFKKYNFHSSALKILKVFNKYYSMQTFPVFLKLNM